PETPISEVERILVEKNIGRVPVIENEKIVGIITRQDILKFRFLKSNIYSPVGSIFQISEEKIELSLVETKKASLIHSFAEVLKTEYDDDKVLIIYRATKQNSEKIKKIIHAEI
ncbi:MAG: CBS domain-containing protein, partial [Ignavibacterium sp.]